MERRITNRELAPRIANRESQIAFARRSCARTIALAAGMESGFQRSTRRDSPFAIRDSLRPAIRVPRPFAPQRAHGFTLIELVAAFVIFALAFGVLLQILGTALHTTAQSAEYTRAAMWAQSLLDVQGIGEPIQEGSSSGRFDDRYGWQLNVARYEPPPVETTVAPLTTADAGGLITTPVTPLDLFRLELVVSWGPSYLRHAARFTTVRVMNPPIQAGNTIPPPAPVRSRQ